MPINQDTKARLEVQGLTGGAAIALSGGAPDSPPLVAKDGKPPVIVGELSEMQNILTAVQSLSAKADTTLGRVDKLVADNSAAVGDAVRNIDAFSKALSDNASGVNSALAGVADLGKKIGPLSDRLQGLSDDVDKLVKAVDPGQGQRHRQRREVADRLARRQQGGDQFDHRRRRRRSPSGSTTPPASSIPRSPTSTISSRRSIRRRSPASSTAPASSARRCSSIRATSTRS